MIKIGITVDGADGLNWPRLQRLAKSVEECGFAGLYLSDHYTGVEPPDRDSLEAWVSLTWLSINTKTIQFGPLVSPFSFRHPTMLARMAAAVDDLSGGRLVLGLGAGWCEREHRVFGLDLNGVSERLKRFEEGAEVVRLLLRSADPVSFRGEFYKLEDAILLPRPCRREGPPILIGGNGKRRTLGLAAKIADEWNGTYLTREKLTELNLHLDNLLVSNGRRTTDVNRSMLTGCILGRTQREVDARLEKQAPSSLTPDQRRAIVAGTADKVVDQISSLAEARLDKIMLVWYDLDDIDGLEAFAGTVLPYL